MTDRRRKRQWLRLIGAVDDDEPSGSNRKVLNTTLIDSTLGSIQGDDIWVALACLDAIENNAEVLNDVTLLKHFLGLGLHRSELTEGVNLQDQQAIYMLAIRKMLLQHKRMTDIWEQVYSKDRERRDEDPISTSKNEDNVGNFDAWEEETPLVFPLSTLSSITLAMFIKQDPIIHAMNLASSHQPSILYLYIKSLPAKLLADLYPNRLAITRELLLSASKVKSSLSQLVQLRLLPGNANGKETSIWTECHEKAKDGFDITDSQEVVQVLNLNRLNRSMNMDKTLSYESTAEEYLSPALLLEFYNSCIDQLAQQTASLTDSIGLADIVMSGKLNLPADESIARLDEDLHILLPLIQGPSSSSSCSTWTIQRLRNELLARPILAKKQAMAILYLERAQSQDDAIKAAREGAVPFIQTITQRNALLVESNVSIEDEVTSGFLHCILALADKAQFRILTYLLQGSIQCGIELQAIQIGRIALACLLGTPNLDTSVRQDLNTLAMSTITTLKGATTNVKEQPLREYIGSALQQGHGRPLPPSQIFLFFASLSASTIKYHIGRCRMYIDLCQRFTKWNNSLTVSRLTNAQGHREDQMACVTRIIRSFARDAKTQDQWTDLTIELMGSVGSREVFDALEDKDVAQLIVEGALRTGDARIYSHIMKSACSTHLNSQEQEDMILQASREFYDNATSANVHQGDMKTAHEVLVQSGVPVTAKIQQEKSFIEATSRLCSFQIQSKLRPGVFLAPIEIRLSPDRMDLIKRLLDAKENVYKTPDLVLDLAFKLCIIPSGVDNKRSTEVPSRSLVESKTLALLIEAALGQADYEQAQLSCERLVANVNAIAKRVEQSVASHGQQQRQLTSLLQQIKEYAYRTCFLLSNQQEWKDHASRLRWCSFVLAYCPDDQVERYLKTWRQLEQQCQQDFILNPPKTWDQVAIQLKAGQGSLASSSLALIGGLGSFEALSPFSTFFAGNRKTPSLSTSNRTQEGISPASAPHKEDSIPARVGSPASRTARLFDSLGGGGGSNSSGDQANVTYLDPAERAARAARRFFGGFA